MDIFNQDFFINNRARLRTLFTGTAPIILSGNGVLQQTSDNTFPFKQDSSFWYFTGIDEPDILLVMDRNKEYLVLSNRHRFSEIADGAIDPEKLTKISGIKTVLDFQEGSRILSNRLKRSKHAAILSAPPAYIEEYGFYTNPARAHLNNRIKQINPEIQFLDIRNHIVKLRSIKQPLELETINKAIDISIKTFKKIKKNINKYEYEYEIEALVLSEFRKNQAKPAYSSIVASGINACTLHYSKNNSKLMGSELVLIDVGADFNHYAADITRTYSRAKPTKRQNQVLNSVLEVQNYALDQLKEGIDFKTYETNIEHFMGERLRELGLIKTIDRESVRKYYPHSTSHFLGLDPHDVGDYTMPLKENMVITVEPGIYIPEEKIGIRIEDDILITKNGYKNLSASLPSSFI